MSEFLSTVSAGTVIQAITAAAVVFVFMRQGGAQAAKTVIDLKNEQIHEYEKRFAAVQLQMQQREDAHRAEIQEREDKHRTEMQELHARLGVIEGQLKSKDSELLRLTNIFQNRDPESAQITKAASDYMTSSLPLLQAIAAKLGVANPTTA